MSKKETQNTYVIIPTKEYKELVATINFIKEKIIQMSESQHIDSFITAQEFMDACKIGRTKFDLSRKEKKIKVIQKDRKLYLQASEIKRYFNAV